MMSAPRAAYNLLAPLAVAGAHAAGALLPKMREAVAGRRGYHDRWAALANVLASPPVWFHVASVGEFEQARPVISALERVRPDIPVIITFSSPSGYHFARRRERTDAGSIRFIDYLPFDLPGAMRYCLAKARPRVLVTVKFDLWPNLVWETSDAGVPVVLIDATLSPSSGRLRAPAGWIYRDVYRRIARILAISPDDAARFARCAPEHEGIAVTGDTRFDRVMERWNQRAATAINLVDDGTPTLLAGSTWPADEVHLLPALRGLLDEHPGLRAVLVPHEPAPAHVASLLQWASDAGASARRLSEPARGEHVVVVDSVGVLAEAYRLAHVAYVGGAFSTGVHSVIEPAIAGVPIVFGPRHDNSFEARRLVELGGGFPASDAAGIRAVFGRLLSDEAARRAAGDAARAYVESQLGATEKCMAAILPYL
ncbi:MAG TPA: glycosyltransferase N-terminal domain-containing protein [Candidatus Krumholzibacteria bacterium]|nr:glycosyltransferase N-terminal domain-containing protein [Candidatus Krumholzibacteria bacterium]